MKCHALVTNCKGCPRWFKSNERMESCPDCGADRHCKNDAVEGYKFCSVHGGPSPKRKFYGLGRGMTTGSGSSFPLTRLAAKYNEMQRDGRLLSNRHSLAIVRHRIEQLADRIDLNEAPDRLAVLQKLWLDYKDKYDSGLTIEAMIIRKRIDEEFDKAYHDYAAWKQMFDALDLDRKLVEAEVKIIKEIQAIVTAEDVYKLQAKLLAAVMNVVSDPKQLRQIQYEFTRIIGEQSDSRPGRSSPEVVDSE